MLMLNSTLPTGPGMTAHPQPPFLLGIANSGALETSHPMQDGMTLYDI